MVPEPATPSPVRWLRDAVADRWLWLLAAVALAQLVPVWATPMFPSQDGPSHLENAYVLLHHGDEGTRFAEFYEIRLQAIPNWLTHLVLAGLLAVLPPLIAEKVLLSAIVVGFVAAMGFLVRGVRGATPVAVLLTAPFAHSLVLYGGLYAFSLGLPLVLAALGLWWRWRAGPWSAGRVVALNALLLGMYLVHILAPVLALVGIGVLALWVHRASLRGVAVAVAAVVPAAVPPAIYLATGLGGGGTLRWPAGLLVAWFVELASITAYAPPLHGTLGPALAATFAVGIGITLVVRLRGGDRSFRDRDGFVLLALVYLALYAVVPDAAGEGELVSIRLSLMPYLALAPWLVLPRSRRVVAWAAAVALSFAGLQLALNTANNVVAGRGLREYTSALDEVRPGEIMLPLSYDHRGGSPAIAVYLHAASYYVVQGGVLNLNNYEASTGHFPLRFRPGRDPRAIYGNLDDHPWRVDPGAYPEPVDVVLLWSPPPDELAASWLVRDYELIHHEGRLWLFRRTDS